VKIIWLASARQSLRAQIEFIAAENPAAAKWVRHRIYTAVRKLAQFADSGRSGEIPGIRELVIPGLLYVVMYRRAGDRVEIHRALHTSQNWPSVMN
jgi:toxin ParE1/3/4